jgi:plastocyanin
LKKTRSVIALLALTICAAIAVPALAATKSVKVQDNSFGPKTLTVKKGTKVTWKWSGMNPHNVTVTSAPKGAKKFHSKTQTSGSFSQTLSKPGTYKIVCTIHQSLGMIMTVKVK